jgi:hypothetical protein
MEESKPGDPEYLSKEVSESKLLAAAICTAVATKGAVIEI